jgi:hypothetical protein
MQDELTVLNVENCKENQLWLKCKKVNKLYFLKVLGANYV